MVSSNSDQNIPATGSDEDMTAIVNTADSDMSRKLYSANVNTTYTQMISNAFWLNLSQSDFPPVVFSTSVDIFTGVRL